LIRTHFKTDFEARSSEKLVGKAGGKKGSEAYWSTSRTLFADNAVPRALQPIAAERSFEMGSSLRLHVTYRSTYTRGVNAHRTQSMGYAHLALVALLLTVAAVSDASLEASEFVNEVTRSLASNG
jgi:hypothetical protein